MDAKFSFSEIDSIAEKVWNIGKAYKVWAFYASMGSGKTTLISSICKLLQVQDIVSSPTFSIINEYNSNKVGTIYHLDLYRLKDEQEAITAGVEDVLLSGNYCFVEWPENALSLLPENCFKIGIEFLSVNERRIWLKN